MAAEESKDPEDEEDDEYNLLADLVGFWILTKFSNNILFYHIQT